jgi:hypothetical protein
MIPAVPAIITIPASTPATVTIPDDEGNMAVALNSDDPGNKSDVIKTETFQQSVTAKI